MSFLTVIFFALVISLSSCSKDQEATAGVGGIVNAVVSIDGVKSLDVSSSLRASIGNQVGLQLPESSQVETFSQDDVSFDVVSEEVDLASQIGLSEKVKNRSKLAAKDLMDEGIKYRLMLYNASNDQFFTSIETEVGVSHHIGLVAGQTYKWFAYSYNTKESIPRPTDLSNPTIITPTANTLLYASGSIKATTNGMPLSITFAHQLTQLKVEVKEGIRAILGTSAKFASSDYVKTSVFNLKNAAKTELKSIGVTDLAFTSLVQGDTVMRVAQYYTADDQLTSYSVDFASIDVQYTEKLQRQLLPGQLPSSGKVSFSFSSAPATKRGYILKGAIKLSFVLPEMRITAFSNSNDYDGFRLRDDTQAGKFLRDPRNFGPNSKYLKIKNLIVTDPSNATLAVGNTTGWNRFSQIMANPPEILIIANWFNYLNAENWIELDNYLKNNGNVFYTHDQYVGELYAQAGLNRVMDQPASAAPITMSSNGEDYGVYKFTDTPLNQSDSLVLRGVFGDVRPYYWGQDRVGSTYVRGYVGDQVSVYTTQSQNYKAPTVPGYTFFKHKTKNFFFVGDGGFYSSPTNGAHENWGQFPFRINSNNLPVLAWYGAAAQYGSPDYGSPGKGGTSSYQIANSIIFGNIIAWMLDRAHYYKK